MECLLLSELGQMKVRVNLKRIIDENGILRNSIDVGSLHEVHFILQLHAQGKFQGNPQCSNFFVPKNLFDEPIIFNYLYQDLSLDAKVAISIWSSAKAYNSAKPLGSTVIQLFDQRGELRQGKYHLFIWPNVSPDLEDPSSTPGLANDQNIQTLNFISDKLQECNKQNDPSSAKAQQTLKFRLSYIYRLIPAAFLEVQFPKLERGVFFSDKISTDYKESGSWEGTQSQLAQCLEIYDPDQENQASDPFEEMYYAIKSERQTDSEKLVPSRDEIRMMEKIASRSFKIEVKMGEKEMLFAFRHFLVQDKRYLTYFLNSLPQQYSDDIQLQKLLSKWQKIDQADALYLLSRDFSLNTSYNRKKYSSAIIKIIRDYAVSILGDLKDQQLTYNLLFLVQALRYQNQIFLSNLYIMLFERARLNSQIASLLHWYLKTQSEPLSSKQSKNSKENQKNIKIYQSIFAKFQYYIQENSPDVHLMIKKQIKLFQILKTIAKVVKQAKDKKLQLRKRLAEVDWTTIGNVSYPMQVSVILLSPVIEQCTVFSSAMAPMKLTFNAQGQRKFSFLFKSGDDLRQDQMVLEMFDLMDRLLKGVNQDYKLTPYKALACSKSDGFVEFVPQTRTFQQTKLKQYLQKLVQQKSAQVMQNYVFSCAGYCAITYFFGIGDRHLENLLISSSGKMLHIDFGFILGRDPKPYPPPIKIRKDMIEAMGGLEHTNFKIFKAKCLQAFLYLRKHGKIVYNLVYLMLDSGLKDVHHEGIAKLFDKFAVGMNDTEAQKHFLMVLQECKNAIAAIIADGIHRWASHFK